MLVMCKIPRKKKKNPANTCKCHCSRCCFLRSLADWRPWIQALLWGPAADVLATAAERSSGRWLQTPYLQREWRLTGLHCPNRKAVDWRLVCHVIFTIFFFIQYKTKSAAAHKKVDKRISNAQMKPLLGLVHLQSFGDVWMLRMKSAKVWPLVQRHRRNLLVGWMLTTPTCRLNSGWTGRPVWFCAGSPVQQPTERCLFYKEALCPPVPTPRKWKQRTKCHDFLQTVELQVRLLRVKKR